MDKKEKKESVELVRKGEKALNPFGMMRRFHGEMERLLEDFGGFRFPTFFNEEVWPFRTEFEDLEWMPQIEVHHHNGRLTVRADLPGMTKDDIKVELTNEMLTMSGERKEEKKEEHEGFYRTERSYGNFYRQIPLPEGVKTDKAEATFVNGVLEISMPAEKVAPQTRKLEVKEAPQAKSAKAVA